MSDIDSKIASIISAKPWLKALLTIATALLGAAKGRGWFAKRFSL